MPEDKNCKALQPPRSCDKNKRKKRKQATASTSPPRNAENPHALPPETSTVALLHPHSAGQDRGQVLRVRATSKKDGERLAGSGRRSRKHLKDSPVPLAATNKNSGYGAGLSAKESVRWEGALEDPQDEEKRLELYRANRRQRYIAHKEALLKETQNALRQTC